MSINEHLKQGTPEWLEWRNNGIGASEVPAIMGESDYSTPIWVYKLKKGLVKPKENNFGMQRGLDAEPRIRALYSMIHDMDMEPALFEHPDLKFMRASLDGYNQEANVIAEFKYPGLEKHELAVSGKIPDCYRGQVQAQLFVTGAKYCQYVSFNGESIAVVKVEPDHSYWFRMIPACEEFWKCIQESTPPPLTEKDYMELNGADDRTLFYDWKRLKVSDPDGTEMKTLRELIGSRMTHNKVECDGVRVIKKNTKNGVSYDFRHCKIND